MFRIHHHAKFQRIPTLRWPTNVENPQILHNLLSQNDANMMKINKLWQNLISSGGCQHTSACQISGHSLRASFPGNALKPQIWPSSLSFFGLCHLVIWQMTLGKKNLISSYNVSVSRKLHKIWVKIRRHGPKIGGEHTDRQTWSIYRAACHG